MIQPLYVYPFPVNDKDRMIIKAAKDFLDLDFQVILAPAFEGKYWEDKTARVLCLRKDPPYICDSATVDTPGTPQQPAEGLIAAIRWCVTDTEDNRASSVLDKMKVLMPGIRELSIDEVAYKDISRRLDLSNEKRVKFR